MPFKLKFLCDYFLMVYRMSKSEPEKCLRIKGLMPLFPPALFTKTNKQSLENNTLK